MSKIFDALRQSQNANSEIAMDRLLEGQAVGTQGSPAAAVRPVGVPPSETAGEEELLCGVRIVPLRVRPAAPILPFDGSHTQAGEEYRILRTKIVQHSKQPRMLVVTSAGPNDGKSVTAINLAGALALKSEARVLLLDADFRRSTIARQLGLSPTPGLVDVLSGKSTAASIMIRAEQIQNLYVMPAGSTAMNPTELLDSEMLSKLYATFRKLFQYIVVDSPPVGVVADYALIEAACDGVVMVVRPDHTDRQSCLEALQALSKTKFLGVTMNGAADWFLDPSRRSRHYYSPYYSKPTKAIAITRPIGESPR